MYVSSSHVAFDTKIQDLVMSWKSILLIQLN